MALPAQAVEKLVRSPERTTGSYTQLLMLSGMLFVLGVVLYLGLRFGYTPYLNSQISKLDKQIEAFSTEIPPSKQEEITRFYSQLVNLKTLLSNHVSMTPFMSWLELNTVQNVYYTKLSANTQNGQISLTGVAKTMDDISAQLSLFESQPQISKVTFNNASLSPSGLWQFGVTLTADKSLFQQSEINPTPVNEPVGEGEQQPIP